MSAGRVVIKRRRFPISAGPATTYNPSRGPDLTPPPPPPMIAPPMYRPGRATKRFDFPPGRIVAGKYEIERPLGSGWEGEVYVIIERATGIRRAAKFYYPHRDPMGKAAITYARKLDALRHCPILMQYHHQEIAYVKRRKVTAVISELVEAMVATLGSACSASRPRPRRSSSMPCSTATMAATRPARRRPARP